MSSVLLLPVPAAAHPGSGPHHEPHDTRADLPVAPTDETSSRADDTIGPLPPAPTPVVSANDFEPVDDEQSAVATGTSQPGAQPMEADVDADLNASQVLDQTGADAHRVASPRPNYQFMSPHGVNDPFPDRAPRVRPRDAGVLLGLGLGLAAAATVTARLALLPDCDNESDVTTCAIPDPQDIGVRSGRLFGAVALGVGGAAFGAFGARELGRLLQQGPPSKLAKRRRLAIGLGSGAVALGISGLVVGTTMLGVGAQRSVTLANQFDTTVSTVGPTELAQLEQTVDQVKFARTGLMVLVASPTLIATGISLLIHRPREPKVSVAPMASRTLFGLSARVRF